MVKIMTNKVQIRKVEMDWMKSRVRSWIGTPRTLKNGKGQKIFGAEVSVVGKIWVDTRPLVVNGFPCRNPVHHRVVKKDLNQVSHVTSGYVSISINY